MYLERSNVVLVLSLDRSSRGSETAQDVGQDTTVLEPGDPGAGDGIGCLAPVDGGSSKNCWHCQKNIEKGVHLV